MDYITDDVIRTPNKSKLWTAIAPSIFQLEHRSKAQNVTNANGYPYSIFKFRCHFRYKISSRPENGGHSENVKYQTHLQFDIKNEKIIPNCARKNIFRVMASSITSQSDLKVVSVYSFMNEKIKIFVITEERTKISSLNVVHICIIILWICLHKLLWIASSMTS